MTLNEWIDALENNDIEFFADVAEEILPLFIELRDRRESALRPATRFLGNDIHQQWTHIISEILEANEELRRHTVNDDTAAIKRMAGELIDIQMSCETMLAIIGLNESQRNDARRRVIAKNESRGYYDDGR